MSEIVPRGVDINGLAEAIGAVLNPLSSNQAEVQKCAIEAELEKHRLAIAAGGEASKRAFWLAIFFGSVGASAVGGFMLSGRYELAVNALYFIGGAASGYGIGRSKRQ